MSRPARVALLFVWVVLCLGLGSVAFPATKKPPPKPVNLNSATSEQLQQIPGIGPARAERILQMRKSYGAFKSVDDLLAVRGIGRKRLDKMRKYLSVGKPALPSKSAGAAKPGAGKVASTNASAAPGKTSAPSNAAASEKSAAANCAGCLKSASRNKDAASGIAKPAGKKAAAKPAPTEPEDALGRLTGVAHPRSRTLGVSGGRRRL